MRRVRLYDTTLRDGTQGEGVSFSVKDKIKIAQRLDELGVDYIEGGWPGSNPKDIEFFRAIQDVPLLHAKIAAFGSTRRANVPVEDDYNIKALAASNTPVVTIVGKSWDFHVTAALRTTLEENLRMISDSVSYFKKLGKEVIYDAEHFFDGFKNNPDYAVDTLRVAQEASADCLVLCDTNGGVLTIPLQDIVEEMLALFKNVPMGIHAHNDSGVAIANTLVAVMAGVEHVQGTINGYGERCGNANLCSVIPNLELKMGVRCLGDGMLANLTHLSRYVSELANLSHDERQPYVGHSSFAHKGGIHVSAVQRAAQTYEHIDPEKVGNHRRVLVSELSGRSSILYKATEYGLDLDKDDPHTREIIEKLKRLEYEGYQFEAAEGSFELLMREAMGEHNPFFHLEGFRVIVEKKGDLPTLSEATIKVRVGDEVVHTAAEGDGPVHALDRALRKALEQIYPALKDIRLTDFKVRVLDEKAGTAALVRVLIESSNDGKSWETVGVSENIIEASWQALVDSIEYGLLKTISQKELEVEQA